MDASISYSAPDNEKRRDLGFRFLVHGDLSDPWDQMRGASVLKEQMRRPQEIGVFNFR